MLLLVAVFLILLSLIVTLDLLQPFGISSGVCSAPKPIIVLAITLRAMGKLSRCTTHSNKLALLLDANITNWAAYLPHVAMAINSTVNVSTQATPYELVYG